MSLAEYSCLLGHDTVLLGEQFPTFWTWRHFDPSKHSELLAQWHSFTSQETWIFHNTALRTSSRSCSCTLQYDTGGVLIPGELGFFTDPW